MTGFYRKPIHNYAKIATPLTYFTRKPPTFKWTDQCQTAFETLKEYLSKAPVLESAQPHQPFILTTDASNTDVGGVLSQTQNDGETQPLGYFSKKLNSTEGRYSITDKEALAVVLACRHFHHYCHRIFHALPYSHIVTFKILHLCLTHFGKPVSGSSCHVSVASIIHPPFTFVNTVKMCLGLHDPLRDKAGG